MPPADVDADPRAVAGACGGDLVNYEPVYVSPAGERSGRFPRANLSSVITAAVFRRVAALVLATGLAVAHAQGLPQRQLPPVGLRGETGATLPLPLVQIDGKTRRLAPGAVLYDAGNRTVLHGALPPGADVYYTVDPQGDILRLYVLTPLEQALLDRQPRRTP